MWNWLEKKKLKCSTNARVLFLYLMLSQRQLVFMNSKKSLHIRNVKMAWPSWSVHQLILPAGLSLYNRQNTSLHSFLLACNNDSVSRTNWLVVARLVNRIFYLLKTAKYCTRGRSWAAGREQQMERSFLIVLISWKTTQEVQRNKKSKRWVWEPERAVDSEILG